MPELKAKHAFGRSESVEDVLQQNIIDEFDILFLDGDTDPKIGWIDRNKNPVIVDNKKRVVKVEADALPDTGEDDIVYLFNENGYIWNGTAFVCLSKPTDLSAIEAEVATKLSADEVDEKINQAMLEDVDYEVAYKPSGTLVDYRKKEIRVMCPSDTEWQLQTSGEGADPNSYYIGFKAYAPDGAASFKEDTAKTISDTTMYYFEDNDFAGIDAQGRKYSVVWLPVAKYDADTDTWTYYGAQSSTEKYIGWYYSVEWYNASGEIIASDCIRINLSNEECHTRLEPFYIQEAIKSANTYTNEQIANITGGIEVIEF